MFCLSLASALIADDGQRRRAGRLSSPVPKPRLAYNNRVGAFVRRPRNGVNGVRFDGVAGKVLLEAKARYGQFLKDGDWTWWFKEYGGLQGLVDEARRHVVAAAGRKIEWHVMQEDVAKAITTLFKDLEIDIKVIYEPLK